MTKRKKRNNTPWSYVDLDGPRNKRKCKVVPVELPPMPIGAERIDVSRFNEYMVFYNVEDTMMLADCIAFVRVAVDYNGEFMPVCRCDFVDTTQFLEKCQLANVSRNICKIVGFKKPNEVRS